MTPEEERYLQQVQAQADLTSLRNTQLQKDYMQVSSFATGEPQNTVQWQLDLSVELDRIDHLLKGEKVVMDERGVERWSKPIDPTSRTLTDLGVDLTMNIISFIINKNVILSNFDEKEIAWKMEDFGKELADVLFFNYEDIFYKPAVEDLMERDLKIIADLERKLNIAIPDEPNRMTTILKSRIDKTILNKIEIIRNKTLEDYEKESERIYQQNKNRYPLLWNLIMQAVHSTYMRAWRGLERESLRSIRHVTESTNLQPQTPMRYTSQYPQQQRRSILKPWTW